MTESANEDMDRIVSLVDYIMGTLAGVELAQAQTALTLSVVAMVCATAANKAERSQMIESFAQQARNYVARDDIVQWVTDSTRQIFIAHGKHQ